MKARLFLLGAGLFLLAAWPPRSHGLWFDEVYTANLVTFRVSLETLLHRVARGDAHPPGFYVLAWAWARATGVWGSAVAGAPEGLEAQLRLLPLALSALTAGLVFAHGGVAAGLLLLSSPAFLERAGEFRMYPLLALFWTLAYLGALWDRPRLLAWSALGALYTHYLAPFLLAPLLGAALLRRGWALLPALWPLLLYLPWVPLFLEQLRGGGARSFARLDPVLALEPLYRLGGLESLSLLALLAVLLGAWRARGPEGLLLLAPFLAPLLWWGASLLVNTVGARYYGAFLPPMALALGLALPRLSPPVRGAFLAAALAAYLGLVLSGAARPAPPDEGFREKARIMEAVARRHPDPLVLGDEFGRLMALRYYWRGEGTLRLLTPQDVERPPVERGALVLLRYAGFQTEPQVGMARLLKALEARGGLRLLDRQAGVYLYLYEEGPWAR